MPPDPHDGIVNTFRLYTVEVKADTADGEATRLDGRWYPKGDTRLAPGASARKEAHRLARLYKVDVRLILKHPVPPPEIVIVATYAHLKRRGREER